MVLAAPSGAGKTSLAKTLVERHDDVVFSVSATTRPPRLHERHGHDYLFVDGREFDRMREAGELVEWAAVHGNWYGTPRRGIEAAIARGEVVVLDIDFQGARRIRASFDDAVLVFILPPSAHELIRRLLERATEDEAERRARLRTARVELGVVHEFDYVVVNDDFETAVATLESILVAERHRRARTTGVQTRLDELNAKLDEILRGTTV